MDNRIMDEQRKLANHFNGLSEEDRKRKCLAMLSYLHGYEDGYQTATQDITERNDG